MFNPSSFGYKTNFPALDEFEDVQQRTKHVLKVKNPMTVDSYGQPKSISAAKAALNWQAENSITQNETLKIV